MRTCDICGDIKFDEQLFIYDSGRQYCKTHSVGYNKTHGGNKK